MNVSKIDKSSKKIPWLAALFGVQVVLALVLFNFQNRQPAGQNDSLLAFDREALDHIEIIAADGKIELRKQDGRWQLDNGLPAVVSRVDELLTEFANLRGGWAVATTDEAASRFEVTEEKFRRKIRLQQGDREVGVLLLGTSPSFRQAHVRRPGTSEIYSVKLDEFSMPIEVDHWLDNQLLRPKGDITALQHGEQRVEKIAGQWPARTPDSVVAAVAPEASVETPAAENAPQNNSADFDTGTFATVLAELTVSGLVKDQAELDAPTGTDANNPDSERLRKIQWQVTTSEGRYEYHLLSKNDQYYIRRGDIDHTFRLSKTQYDALAKIQGLRQS